MNKSFSFTISMEDLKPRLASIGVVIPDDVESFTGEGFEIDGVVCETAYDGTVLTVQIISQPQFLGDEAVENIIDDFVTGSKEVIDLDEKEVDLMKIDELHKKIETLAIEKKASDDKAVTAEIARAAIEADRDQKATMLVNANTLLDQMRSDLSNWYQENQKLAEQVVTLQTQLTESQQAIIDLQAKLDATKPADAAPTPEQSQDGGD